MNVKVMMLPGGRQVGHRSSENMDPSFDVVNVCLRKKKCFFLLIESTLLPTMSLTFSITSIVLFDRIFGCSRFLFSHPSPSQHCTDNLFHNHHHHMCTCSGIGTKSQLEFTVVYQDFTTFILSTSTQVLQSLNYDGFKSIEVPHTYSVSQPLLSPVYLYGIVGQTDTKNCHTNLRLLPKFLRFDVSIFRQPVSITGIRTGQVHTGTQHTFWLTTWAIICWSSWWRNMHRKITRITDIYQDFTTFMLVNTHSLCVVYTWSRSCHVYNEQNILLLHQNKRLFTVHTRRHHTSFCWWPNWGSQTHR